jgi:uncharacterized membrane protein YdbT with pleckstrin-like domain
MSDFRKLANRGIWNVGYIERSLGKSETLLYKARFHQLYFTAAWTMVGSMAVLALAAAYSLRTSTSSGYGILMLIAIVALAWGLTRLIPIWTTEIGVTNQRLIVKRGWLSLSTDELQLRAIEQVNLNQGLVGRVFDFGRVDVHGTGVDDVRIPSIAEPLELVKKIEDAASQAKPGASTSAAQGA